MMRDQSQVNVGPPALAALARSLRKEAGLSTRQLAARSTLARSTITRLEAAQLRPRRSMLTVLAIGLDPARARELLGQLVEAAGDDMAEDTPGWRRYRRRRIRRGLLAGTVPVPADVAARMQLHQSSQALLRQVRTLQASRSFWRDPDTMDLAHQMMARAEALRAEAGPWITVSQIQKHLTEGMDPDEQAAPARD
jgi:transcriptional regulator with XRE-family HTH domain